MDLNQVSDIALLRDRSELADWRTGDGLLAGGTWLFSEPQPQLRRLLDLTGLGWTPLMTSPAGLQVAATCTIAELAAATLPKAWAALPLIGQCCRALLGSFKIWNMATVGGNICMALPAGPMTALAVALDGVGTIWTPDGGARTQPIRDLVRGVRETTLQPGEVLRQIDLPAAALSRRTALRRISLSPAGRSGVLLIGTSATTGDCALTVTASIRRPVQLYFPAVPDADTLRRALDRAIPETLYYDDVHGRPDWRRALTYDFAEQLRVELGSGV